MGEESRSLAMLIDGDNISPYQIKTVIDEASIHGKLQIRRVYGDWTKPDLMPWKEAANSNAIRQVQQSNYTTGKNSTDGALIIEAMEMLYTRKIDGFCIVSSDSDYTGLATILREAGKFVLGIGSRQTPQSLVNACDRFTHIETIAAGNEPSSGAVQDPESSTEWVGPATKAIEELTGDGGVWALLAAVGQRLRATNPAFDPRAYRFKNLHSLIKSEPDLFVLESHYIDGMLSGHKVRLKSKPDG